MEAMYKKVLEHYGKESQLKKTLEELKELRLEIFRDLIGHGTRQAILEEMADVLNMCNQLTLIFEFNRHEILSHMIAKMDRTIKRIEEETP